MLGSNWIGSGFYLRNNNKSGAMRKRSFDLRRSSSRRRWSSFTGSLWAWILVAGFCFLMLIVLLSRQPGSDPSLPEKPAYTSLTEQNLTITDEMISPYSFTRQLIEQISLAKTLTTIAKESNNIQFASDLTAQIRRSQSHLSKLATSSARTDESEQTIRDMALLLFQAQQLHYDASTVILKLKGQIQALEEKSKIETEKSTKYGQIAAEMLPKGLFCLGVRLTTEWFKNPVLNNKRLLNGGVQFEEKLRDNNLYHYCIFSDNILAVSVVVNSTTVNSNHPEKIVFHLVTDEVNFFPMKAWFSLNNYKGATVEVRQVADFHWLNASYVPVLKQLQDSETQNFYFTATGERATPIKFRNPKYLSMLNHLRFYIPEIYPQLQKVVFLDDDVVVQKDLTELFNINLNGNVMGAVETCMETFHRFHKYLNYSHPLIRLHFDPDACGWAFGMNILDLKEWRLKNVTGIYHYWQERNVDHTLWKLGTLPPGLLAFYGLVQPLDARWHVLGLGYTNVDAKVIKEGAVLHYNGNLKPWLKIGMEKYKGFWDKYVDYSHPLLQQCIVR